MAPCYNEAQYRIIIIIIHEYILTYSIIIIIREYINIFSIDPLFFNNVVTVPKIVFSSTSVEFFDLIKLPWGSDVPKPALLPVEVRACRLLAHSSISYKLSKQMRYVAG